MELAPLAAAEFVDVAVLFFGREEEVLKELRGREVPTAAEVDVFGDVGNDVDRPGAS